MTEAGKNAKGAQPPAKKPETKKGDKQAAPGTGEPKKEIPSPSSTLPVSTHIATPTAAGKATDTASVPDPQQPTNPPPQGATVAGTTEAKASQAKVNEASKQYGIVKSKDVGGGSHSLYYQDLLIYEKESKPGTFILAGRDGKEIDAASPLAQLKENGRRCYLARKEKYKLENHPNESDVYDIKLMIVITMYNESEKELKDSISGIQLAIREMLQDDIKSEEIVVFLIADGFAKIAPEFLEEMAKVHVYDESKINAEKYFKTVNGKRDFVPGFNFSDPEQNRLDDDKGKLKLTSNVCHLFQSMNCELAIHRLAGDIVEPCNFFFGIKHLNGGKLDSHFWFFKGFAEYLQPHYCFLVDIGTKPEPKSLSVLVRYLDDHPNCGGVCGEIQVDMDEKLNLCAPGYWLSAGQFVEYKMSHFFDKAFESFFGFVSVLPGAFSGYRWVAIKEQPLTNYFKGLDKQDLDLAQGNMFLAEDRIMCVSILTNEHRKDVLTYVPGARAVTDPPTSLGVLMKQRRRWINGSNFALLHVLASFLKLWNTDHSLCRKIIFTLFYFHQILLAILGFLIVGTSYASFSVFARHSFPADNWYNMSSMLENAYLIVLFLILIWSLCKPVDKSEAFYLVISIALGVLMCFMMYFTYLYFFQDFTHLDGKKGSSYSFWLVLIILLSMVLPVILNLPYINRPCLFILGFFVYTFLTPTYMNIFTLYSFCNTHDLTWGNRPQQITNSTDGIKQQQDRQKKQQESDDNNKSVRTYILVAFLIVNIGIGYAVTRAARAGSDDFILILSAYIVGVVVLKLIFCIAYVIQWGCCGHCCLPPRPKALRSQPDPQPPDTVKPLDVAGILNKYAPRAQEQHTEVEDSP